MKKVILIVVLLLSSSANAAIMQFNFGGVVNAIAPNPSLVNFAVGDLWNATIFVETNNPIEASNISTYTITSAAYNVGSFAFSFRAATINEFRLADSNFLFDMFSTRQAITTDPSITTDPLPPVGGHPYRDVGIQLFDVDTDVFTGTSISQLSSLTVADFKDGEAGSPLGVVTNRFYLAGDGGSIVTGTVTDFSATAVPVPAAVWLLGSALVGLLSVARRKIVV